MAFLLVKIQLHILDSERTQPTGSPRVSVRMFMEKTHILRKQHGEHVEHHRNAIGKVVIVCFYTLTTNHFFQVLWLS